MYKGLVIARKPILHNNEIVLTFQDSHGETIEIKQTITDVMGKTVRIRIEAPGDVIGVYKLLSYVKISSQGIIMETIFRSPNFSSCEIGGFVALALIYDLRVNNFTFTNFPENDVNWDYDSFTSP